MAEAREEQELKRTVELRPTGHDDKVTAAEVVMWTHSRSSGTLYVDVKPLPEWWREIDRLAPSGASHCFLILNRRADGVYVDAISALEFKVTQV